MQINWLLLGMYVVAALVEIGLPVTLAVLLARRFKVAWAVVLTGILTFIGSQVVHIPLLQVLPLLYKAGKISALPQNWPIWAYSLYMGAMAGLCEETARLIGFKALKNKAKGFTSALGLGIGHGGLESVIVGGIVLTSLLTALLYNSAAQLAHGVSQDEINAVQAQIASFWTTPWHLPLAGAVERITAISAHLIMSILVWKTAVQKKAWGYPLAVLYHTVMDGSTVWLTSLNLSAWQIEGALCFFLVLSLILIWRFWATDKTEGANEASLPVLEA